MHCPCEALVWRDGEAVSLWQVSNRCSTGPGSGLSLRASLAPEAGRIGRELQLEQMVGSSLLLPSTQKQLGQCCPRTPRARAEYGVLPVTSTGKSGS